jgi:hypothetical protein
MPCRDLFNEPTGGWSLMGRGEEAMKTYWVSKDVRVIENDTQIMYINAHTNTIVCVQDKLF